MGHEIEPLRDGDEPMADELGAIAFGPEAPPDADRPRPPNERVLAVYDGSRLMATTTTLQMGQFFGGRSVPMGGLAGVKVDPLDRGRGLARRLLLASLDEMRNRGEHLSTLYPTTASLYRSVGYEMSGSWTWSRLDLRDLPTDIADTITIEPGDYLDPALREAYRRTAARNPGWLDRPELSWTSAAHALGRSPATSWLYQAIRAGETVGAIRLTQDRADSRLFGLRAPDLFGVDDEVLAALLGFAARQGTTAAHLSTLVPFRQLARVVTHAQWTTIEETWPWMSRLVDAAGAIAARGFAPDLDIEVPLLIDDPVLTVNSGAQMLVVSEGVGRLERGGPGTIELSVQDLASLFTGWADAGELAWSGRLRGADESHVAALTRAFAGPAPTLVDFF